MKTTAITAHSGCENTPDNSMESILAGIQAGADSVEVDVRIDGQGRLWLSHDDPGDYAGVVSLEEAFHAIASSSVSINCDLKDYRALYPVIALADSCSIPRERLIFSGSVDVRLLIADPQISRRARIFLNTEELCLHMADPIPQTREEEMRFFDENLPEIAALVRQLGIEAINAPYAHVPHDRIAAMRSAGIALSLWTVNKKEDMARLLREDLLSLTTRRVYDAMQIRSSLAK